MTAAGQWLPTSKELQMRQCCFRTRSLVVRSSITETMTIKTDPLMGPLRSAMETSSGSIVLLLPLTYCLAYAMPYNHATNPANLSDSLYSTTTGTRSSSSDGSSSPSTAASLLDSITAARSFSDSGSSRNRSVARTRSTSETRCRRRTRHGHISRKTSSGDYADARPESSDLAEPSLDDLRNLPWSRLDKKSLQLPPGASWVISIRAVKDGKQR